MPVPATTPIDTLSPLERLRCSPNLAEVLRHFRSPDLTSDHGLPAAYALLPRLEAPTGALIYPSLPALARRIHRDRGADQLELRTAELRFRDRVRQVTEVIARDLGGRARRIGFAWHAGRPRAALEAALAALVPNASVEG